MTLFRRLTAVLLGLMSKMANSFGVILWVYAGSILVSSTLFALIEDRSWGDGVWWSFVTALTIGYGDVAPVTVAGRVLGVVMSHFWIMVVAPCIVARIVVGVLHDKNEYTHAEQEWVMDTMAQVAAKVGVQAKPQPRDTSYGDVAEPAL